MHTDPLSRKQQLQHFIVLKRPAGGNAADDVGGAAPALFSPVPMRGAPLGMRRALRRCGGSQTQPLCGNGFTAD